MTVSELHPMVVHFPIALLSVSVICDGIAVFFNRDEFLMAGEWNLNFGILSAVAAIITGFLTDRDYGHMSDPFPLFSTHGSVQILSFILFIGLWFWRKNLNTDLVQNGYIYVLAGLVTTGLLFYGSYLGAVLGGRI